MSLYESRAQSPDKDFNDSVSMTKASTAFKASGRQSRIHWANRFNKDFNDLDYDIKFNLIKGKAQLNAGTKHYKNKLKKSSSRPVSESKSQRGVSMDKYKNRFDLMKMNKTLNPEQYTITEDKKYSTLDSQGLCKFEFEKTIGGRLIHKSNHHMGFQYQTQRSKNLNPVWYNADNELMMEKMRKTMKKRNVQKCHDFASYSARKVFEPREELDKFYDTKQARGQATRSTIKETAKMESITGRRDERPRAGTQLSYREYQAKKKVMRRAESYEIEKSKRQLKFGRQVISSARGCYR